MGERNMQMHNVMQLPKLIRPAGARRMSPLHLPYTKLAVKTPHHHTQRSR